MTEFKVGDRVKIEGTVHKVEGGLLTFVGDKGAGAVLTVHDTALELVEPAPEPEPHEFKPGDDVTVAPPSGAGAYTRPWRGEIKAVLSSTALEVRDPESGTLFSVSKSRCTPVGDESMPESFQTEVLCEACANTDIVHFDTTDGPALYFIDNGAYYRLDATAALQLDDRTSALVKALVGLAARRYELDAR